MTKATLEFNTNTVANRIKKRISIAQSVLDSQVLKDSNYYAPDVTGQLKDSGINGSKIGSGLLKWSAEYAKAQYYGLPNKSRIKNPNARSKWFEYAKAINASKWEKMTNDKYNKWSK